MLPFSRSVSVTTGVNYLCPVRYSLKCNDHLAGSSWIID